MSQPTLTESPFGQLPDGREATLYTLTNANGMIAKISNLGGVIAQLHVPDRDGVLADVCHGFDDVAPYLGESHYFGALIGRYGNRIGKGRFTLDGQDYQLDVNNGDNHLHGGTEGFHRRLWAAETFATPKSAGLILSYLSADGEQGYPGNLEVTVIYELRNDNELRIAFHGISDQATPVNLTNHAYFNLAGKGDILGHELTIHADAFTPVDSGLIPTGELPPVAGTPFDFRAPHAIGARKNDKKVKLRSAEWFGTQDKNGFMYRSWMKNQGIPDHEFQGKPIIGICNTWSELTPCNAHFRKLAEHVKRGIYGSRRLPGRVPGLLERRIESASDRHADP
jgi:aldose 1-epimerase